LQADVVRILAVSNLYPRPDDQQRGLFNAQQFEALAELGVLTGGHAQAGPASVKVLCLVPEWRWWRWEAIRRWEDPFSGRLAACYLPTFYVPVLGRNFSWRTYCQALELAAPRFMACDAVLAAWLYPDAVAAACLAARWGKPLWIKVHGTDRFHLHHPRRRTEILKACAQARAVVCVSASVRADVCRAGVNPEKTHVVPNGVDTRRFRYRSPEEARRELGANGIAARRMVLYVANLVRIKGPDIMLEAWHRLAAEGAACEGWRLMILGDGPLRRKLEQRARCWGLARSVVFLGSRPHAEVALWMNVADCLCLTSRSEGMPNVILEALASGLPVVATRAGAAGELLEGEEASRLVEKSGGDVAERVAQAVKELLAQQIDRQALAARHARRLSWEQSARRLWDLLLAGMGM